MLEFEFKEQLRSVAQDILKEGDFHESLAPAISKYHQLLFEMLEIDPDDEKEKEHIETEKGNAIGTWWAATCVKEVFRTQRFAKALAQAIRDIHCNEKRTVHVLYAGTGPFAALALPIMLTFQPTEVQFTLLEINQNSYGKLQDLMKRLDLLPYVKESKLADATSYVLKNYDVDIVLSETMNLALFKEPQVSIMMNFERQLGNKALYLPNQIKVALCKQGRKDLDELKTLIKFDQLGMAELNKRTNANQELFEKIALEVELAQGERLCYHTEITIYKGFKLGLNDSSLTLLKPVKPNIQAGRYQLSLQYQVSNNPGFVVESKNIDVQN